MIVVLHIIRYVRNQIVFYGVKHDAGSTLKLIQLWQNQYIGNIPIKNT